ncbi:hypothetical protein [Pectobacterium carotovorum]|uniref:hypothetical protein n=1 Tax=Pectobacterium carotovorum TaxID=554 RepID=UPI00208903BA|nr:hypothetical protein [Pectobacterium carotovorum]GKV88192.1 hypothetical protein PEC301619_01740 [Pectobacterium carotovorum subsp. carotovorum]
MYTNLLTNAEKLIPLLGLLPLIGAACAFCWGMIVFILNRKRENDEAQFKRFHEIIRKIQHDTDKEGNPITNKEGKHEAPYIDVQIAAIYELRFLKKYYPLSKLYLEQKKIDWQKRTGTYLTVAIPTIESTIQFIEQDGFLKKFHKYFPDPYKDNSPS